MGLAYFGDGQLPVLYMSPGSPRAKVGEWAGMYNPSCSVLRSSRNTTRGTVQVSSRDAEAETETETEA